MSTVDDPKPEQIAPAEERVNDSRRKAMVRLAKYTAPVMLALLLSADKGTAFATSAG
jgi:hypothetical protein